MDALKEKLLSVLLKVVSSESDDVDKKLEEEGLAPKLNEVDDPEKAEEDDAEEALMNGEERMVSQKMEGHMKPRGLGDRVQMEIMKKKAT